MGKTFVALAIAHRYSRRLIVVPAALRAMWRDALAQADMDAELITFERLSRSEAPPLAPELLILDEAHHARNPSTRRYARIARLARDARVLLLSATPVHNRWADLVALLSLFLGSRARALSERELSQCVVRRERSGSSAVAGIPDVLPVVGCDLPDNPGLVAQLMSIPPPLPARDGESGGALINRGLLHQWSSSEAALRDALRRRLAKATALIASLEVGRYPSARELEAWTYAEGALQLGFAELLSPPTPDAAAQLRSVSAHAKALEHLLRDYGESSIDEARAHTLADIRARNPTARIVAFAQYGSTVSALYRRLASAGGVAVLTATGARVAGGKLSREDAIARFAPLANRVSPPSPAESIDLLLTTDLLSEGVNLQDAEIVVHLDVPWTAARMEQRVGRAARMGSRHQQVKVYQLRPPASAEEILRGEALVSLKHDVARKHVGASRVGPLATEGDAAAMPSSIPSQAEELRAILCRWLDADSNNDSPGRRICVGAVTAGRMGLIAAGYHAGTPLLLACLSSVPATDLQAQIASCLLAEGADALVDRADYEEALRAVKDWAERYQASENAGAIAAAPVGRQRLLRRIDAALQRAPPHLRASRARAVSAARQIASAPHGVAVEEDLEALAASTLPDDEWLGALASVAPLEKRAQPVPQDFQPVALLLLSP